MVHKYAKTVSTEYKPCKLSNIPSQSDADVLTLTTAVESARQRNTVHVGVHTDLLVIDGMDMSSVSNQNQF